MLEGARNIVRWKKALGSSTPHTIFQFLVVRPNEHQIPEIYRLAKEIGIDEVKLKTAQIYERYGQFKGGFFQKDNRPDCRSSHLPDFLLSGRALPKPQLLEDVFLN